MSKFVFERFNREKSKATLNALENRPIPQIEDEENEKVVDDSGEKFVDNSKIIDPEILKQELLDKINPKPKIIMNAELSNASTIEMVHFMNLGEFVEWYKNNKEKFSEKQSKALDTLVEAQSMTVGGCNCNLQHRKHMAEQYFRNFWINNQKTDILDTLQKIINSKKIIFGDFLAFPP